MSGEIFISYRRADQAKAVLLWKLLHERGVDAWYDQLVPSGEDWRAATANALVAAPIFVLLFSRTASQSEDIAKELGAATFQKKLVIPVRLEDIHPEGAFLYELAARNWFDAFNDTDARLAILADRLAALVKGGKDAQHAAIKLGAPGGQKIVAKEKKRKVSIYAIGGMIIAGLALVMPTIRDLISPGQPATAASTASGQRIAFFGFTAPKDDERAASVASAATDQGFRAFSIRQSDIAARASTVDAVDAGDDTDDRINIAAEIDARFALGGEIRSEGGRMRATIHLDDTATRATLWNDSYDGDAAQPEVAAMQIGLRAAEVTYCITTLGYTRFNSEPRDDSLLAPAANACGIFATGSDAGISALTRYVRDVAKHYPDHGLTQARLAYLAVETMIFAPSATKVGLLAEAKTALAAAEKLSPDSYATATARMVVGVADNQPPLVWAQPIEASLGRTPAAGETFYFGLANRQAGTALSAVGRLVDALPYYSAATENDPVSPFSNLIYAYTLAAAGRPGSAERFDDILSQRRVVYGWDYALSAALFLGAGDPERLFAAPPVGTTQASIDCRRGIQAALKLTSAPARLAAAKSAASCLNIPNENVTLIQMQSMLGDLDGAFSVLDRPDMTHMLIGLDISPLFFPSTRAIRADQRFLPLMEKLGYVDYWKQTKTQPDVCSAAEKDIPLCVALRS
jgi:TolB-like protein